MDDTKERLIFALDVRDLEKAVWLLDQLEGKVGMVKVNSLALAYPQIVSIIQDRKIKVWRDFKHHDIPGTVANFIKADVKDKLEMTTIHTLGGRGMMEYAVKAAEGSSLKILGITILTSHTQESFNKEIGVPGFIQDKVVNLAKIAEDAGLAGVVGSAKEAKKLRNNLKDETLIVTPGIKPSWAAKREDQARITTPHEAITGGATHIVVGSAIYQNENPGDAADEIVKEIEEALGEI